MWRLCCKHGVDLWILSLRRRNYKHCYSHQEKILRLSCSKLQYRSLSSIPKTSLPHPQHGKDKVPEDFALIYENKLKRVIGPARVLATAAGLASAALSLGYVLKSPETVESWNVYVHSGICLFSLFMTIFVNLMFRYYLLRIYFNKDKNTFIGVYYSFLGNLKHIKYSLADLQAVKRPLTDKVHIKCNFVINGRRFHVTGEDFILPVYYNMHLGLA